MQIPEKTNIQNFHENKSTILNWETYTRLFIPFEVDKVYCGDSFCLFREVGHRKLVGVGQNRGGQCGRPYFEYPFVAEPAIGFDLDLIDDPDPYERIIEVAPSIASTLVRTNLNIYFMGNMLSNRLPSKLVENEEIKISKCKKILLDQLCPELSIENIKEIVHSRNRSALILEDGRAVLFGGTVSAGEFPIQIYTPNDFEGLKIKAVSFGEESEFVYCESD